MLLLIQKWKYCNLKDIEEDGNMYSNYIFMFILEGVNMRLMKMMKSIFAEHYNLVQMKSEGIKRR